MVPAVGTLCTCPGALATSALTRSGSMMRGSGGERSSTSAVPRSTAAMPRAPPSPRVFAPELDPVGQPSRPVRGRAEARVADEPPTPPRVPRGDPVGPGTGWCEVSCDRRAGVPAGTTNANGIVSLCRSSGSGAVRWTVTVPRGRHRTRSRATGRSGRAGACSAGTPTIFAKYGGNPVAGGVQVALHRRAEVPRPHRAAVRVAQPLAQREDVRAAVRAGRRRPRGERPHERRAGDAVGAAVRDEAVVGQRGQHPGLVVPAVIVQPVRGVRTGFRREHAQRAAAVGGGRCRRRRPHRAGRDRERGWAAARCGAARHTRGRGDRRGRRSPPRRPPPTPSLCPRRPPAGRRRRGRSPTPRSWRGRRARACRRRGSTTHTAALARRDGGRPVADIDRGDDGAGAGIDAGDGRRPPRSSPRSLLRRRRSRSPSRRGGSGAKRRGAISIRRTLPSAPETTQSAPRRHAPATSARSRPRSAARPCSIRDRSGRRRAHRRRPPTASRRRTRARSGSPPTGIVDDRPCARSIRETVPSSWFATHTEPAPDATASGAPADRGTAR